ncbi:MAG: TRAP transporter substrate-binding protein [Bauldia litoralis]
MKRIAIAAVALTALSGTAPAVGAETVFNWSSFVPWVHPINKALYIPWIEAVEKATEGRVKFNRLPKPVTAPRGHHEAVRTGQADAAFMVHGYLAKRFAAYQFASFPFLGDDAVIASVALQRTHDKFFAGKGYYKGVKLVGLHTHGPGHFYMRTKHVTTPADIKGVKIRTGGPVPLAMVEHMGAVSVRQPVTKAYELLAQGVVDGITFPWESVTSFRITKLVPFATEVPGGLYSASMYLILSEKKYDGLSDADKKAMAPYMGENYSRHAGSAWNKVNARGRAVALKAGSKIIDAPAPVVAAVKEVNDRLEKAYIADAAKLGLDGAAVLSYFRAQAKAVAGK